MTKKRASLPQEFKCQPIFCNGVLFPSRNALAAHYGVNRCTIKQRIRKGMTVEEAVLTPVKNLRKPSWSEGGVRICATCQMPMKDARNRQATCTPCRHRYSAEYRLGVPQGTHVALWEEQQGRCLCCHKKFNDIGSQRAPHMDHCHTTGTVRGLLCNACNSALGMINDSYEHALALAEYIRLHCDPLKQGAK